MPGSWHAAQGEACAHWHRPAVALLLCPWHVTLVGPCPPETAGAHSAWSEGGPSSPAFFAVYQMPPLSPMCANFQTPPYL